VRQDVDGGVSGLAYGSRTMLRPEPTESRATISDRELGVAALLLLVSVVLSVAFLPAIM